MAGVLRLAAKHYLKMLVRKIDRSRKSSNFQTSQLPCHFSVGDMSFFRVGFELRGGGSGHEKGIFEWALLNF